MSYETDPTERDEELAWGLYEDDDDIDAGPPAPGEGDHLPNPEATMKC